MRAYGGKGMVPLILNLGTIWKWLFKNYVPAALMSGIEPRYQLNRRLGGAHSHNAVNEIRDVYNLKTLHEQIFTIEDTCKPVMYTERQLTYLLHGAESFLRS
jgi:hypothetical protein